MITKSILRILQYDQYLNIKKDNNLVKFVANVGVFATQIWKKNKNNHKGLNQPFRREIRLKKTNITTRGLKQLTKKPLVRKTNKHKFKGLNQPTRKKLVKSHISSTTRGLNQATGVHLG